MTRAAGAAALLLVAILAAGCGGAKPKAPKLAWVAAPVAYEPNDLPTDRVVLAKVVNSGAKPIRLEAAKLVVHDADDHVLRSSGRYIAGYAHGLYGAFQKPDPLPPDELKRLGLVITLAPGKTAPLAVAWRLAKGSKQPVRVDYGGGSLQLPAASRPAG